MPRNLEKVDAHCMALLILLCLFPGAHAKALADNRSGNSMDSMDKLANKLAGKLFNKALRALPIHRANVDSTVLQKPCNPATVPYTSVSSPPLQVYHRHHYHDAASPLSRYQSPFHREATPRRSNIIMTALPREQQRGPVIEKAQSAMTRAEFGFLEQLGRRLNVHWLASQLFPSKEKGQSANITRAEPGFFEKVGRRIHVYWLASQVFLDYQIARFKEHRLKQRLGIGDDHTDHPSMMSLWNSVHERNSAKLLKNIHMLEGFWIKVGQYMSSRADVIPSEYLTNLAGLQDSMPQKPFTDIMATLKEELSQQEMDRFESIDPAPLSTASLAQVHRATLKDGREVVLKVQHRGVASLMIQDMANLKSILETIARLNPDWDFGPVIREYSKEVQKELDFRIEAKNMNQVRELLDEYDVRAIVPKVVLAKERVLVMDFCRGFVIRDTDALDKYGVDRELLLKRVCQSWAFQMHVGGVFNADPHPGNILVSTEARDDGDQSVPVLLDFGLTKRFDAKMKLAFARLMHASDENDVDALLQSFEEMGLKMNRYDPFEDMAAMQRSFGKTVPQSQAKQAAKEKSKRFKRRMEAMREDQDVKKGQSLRNPVDAWPSELIFFFRVTNMLRGLCSRLDVAYPYLNTMAVAARETLKESVPLEARATQLIHASAETIDTPLQKRLVSAVQKLQEDGQMVGLQLSVMQKGHLIANIASGTLGTANPRPVTPSSLFCVFSVSKAILTIAMLRLLQEKHIDLDDPVAKHWPAFAGNGKAEVTIRHVLTHQAGLANAFPEDATLDVLCDFEAMTHFMERARPEHDAGFKTQYHYLSFAWICGGIIEHVTGQPYDAYLDSFLNISPSRNLQLFLGGLPDDLCNDELAVLSVEKATDQHKERAGSEATRNSTHETTKGKGKKVLAKYRGREQLLNPSIFNMRKVRQAKIPSANGHASAAALAAVFDSILNNETVSPPLSSSILEQARRRQPPPVSLSLQEEAMLMDGASFGLGFQSHEFILPDGSTARSVGHAGLGGSIVLALPEASLSVAFVTNRLSRNSQARQKLLNIVWDEFGLEAPATIRL